MAIFKSIRIIIGLTFLLSGLAKIPEVEAFVTSTSQLIEVDYSLAMAISIVLIVLEITAGILLLTKKYVRLSSLLVVIALVLFILVLSVAVLQQRLQPCYCFGAIGLRLTPAYQVLLDTVLLMAGLITLRNAGPNRTSADKTETFLSSVLNDKFVSIPSVLCLLWAFVLVWFQSIAAPINFGSKSLDAQSIHAVLSNPIYDIDNSGKKLLIVVDEDDFSCIPCYQDFKSFYSRATEIGIKSNVAVLVKVPEYRKRVRVPTSMTESWISKQSTTLAVQYDREGMMETIGIEKTAVVLITENNEVLGHQTFPMGEESHK